MTQENSVKKSISNNENLLNIIISDKRYHDIVLDNTLIPRDSVIRVIVFTHIKTRSNLKFLEWSYIVKCFNASSNDEIWIVMHAASFSY